MCWENSQMCNQRVQWCVTGCLPWYEARGQLSGDVWPLKHPTPRNMPSVKHTPALQSPSSCCSVAPNPSVIFTYLHTTTHDSLVIFPIIPLQQTLNGWGGGRMWLGPAAKVCGLSGRWATEKLSYDLRNFHIKAMHTGQINKISGLRHSRLCNKS